MIDISCSGLNGLKAASIGTKMIKPVGGAAEFPLNALKAETGKTVRVEIVVAGEKTSLWWNRSEGNTGSYGFRFQAANEDEAWCFIALVAGHSSPSLKIEVQVGESRRQMTVKEALRLTSLLNLEVEALEEEGELVTIPLA